MWNNKKKKPYKKLWKQWKKQPCSDCGLMFPMVLEADHCKNRGKKIKEVSDIRGYWNRKPIALYQIELDKCIPLCIMCHRKKTQEVNTEVWCNY